MERDAIRERLVRRLGSPTYEPPVLPRVAVEVMALSRRTDVSVMEVVKVLAGDPLLAARVLSLAQSAAFTGRAPILSLQQAAVRLGLRLLGQVVLQAALQARVFRVAGFEGPMERLSRHATASAHLTRLVCRRVGIDQDYAFLCGLLHDVGFAAALMVLVEDPALRSLGFATLAPAIDEVHEETAGIVARLWALPEELCRFVETHHDLEPGGQPSRLHAAVFVAEQLAWEAGCGLMPPPPDASPLALTMPEPPALGIDVNWPGVVEDACALLQLDDLTLCATRAEAFQIVQALFGAIDAGGGRG